jgi:ParB-like chromosome segregation protein Spo0J
MERVYRMMPVGELRPNPRNSRTHSKKQIRTIAKSIRACGFAAPVLIDENGTLLAGHARLEAAKEVGLAEIPAFQLLGLSETQKRALLRALRSHEWRNSPPGCLRASRDHARR